LSGSYPCTDGQKALIPLLESDGRQFQPIINPTATIFTRIIIVTSFRTSILVTVIILLPVIILLLVQIL